MYAINKDTFTNDGYLALPVASLGTKYFLAAYFPPSVKQECAVVAVEDNTDVTIFDQTGRLYSKPSSGSLPSSLR